MKKFLDILKQHKRMLKIIGALLATATPILAFYGEILNILGVKITKARLYEVVGSNLDIFGIVIGITLIITIAVVILVMTLSRNGEEADTYFVHTTSSLRKKKDTVLHLINNSTNEILCSHSKDSLPPTKAYIDAMTNALERGVKVTRIVMRPHNDVLSDPTLKWLHDQIRDNKVRHQFLEFGLEKLPVEFYIFDREVAILALPSLHLLHRGELSSLIITRNPDLVKSIENAMRCMCDEIAEQKRQIVSKRESMKTA